MPDDDIRRACDALRPLCQDRGVAFLLNDRPDLAAETGCDGVHVGQEDTTYAEARRIVGDDAIVGVTCHDSRHLAMEAAEAGADYVAFGAFFPTETKMPKGHPTPELLRWWSEITVVPSVPSAASRRRTAGRWYEPGPVSWRWSAACGTTRRVRRRRSAPTTRPSGGPAHEAARAPLPRAGQS